MSAPVRPLKMLYDGWREIVSAHPGEIALTDLATARRWTFAELARASEKGPVGTSAVAFPAGGGADFIFEVLRAWRAGQVVCPLEPGQTAPAVGRGLPAGVVHLKTTSATTGASRLVAFTAEQLSADAENIVRTMGLRPDWPNLAVISLAHSYGFSNLVLPLLLHGIPLLLGGTPLPEIVRRAADLQTSGITLAAVPALWRTWQEANAIPANVRLAISAGAPLPLALEEAVHSRHGLKIHNFYGSSECGGIAFDPSSTPRREAACAGAPICNVQVCINEEGCVQVAGRAVGQTYWPQPAPSLDRGVFRTSDLGEIVDGLVYLRGRAGDQINVAGRKVLPEVIEEVLSEHPQVRGCLVFGVPSPDPQRGEAIVACIAGAGRADPADLKKFALERLPAWQVPREWWFVDSLESNERGKLSRAEWRKRYLAKK